jgi:hypothetical protein
MKKLLCLLTLFLLVCIHLCLPPYAEAYLDPGTGSYILQLLIAGLLSALVMFKPILAMIKNTFAKLLGKEKDSNEENHTL